MTDWPFSDPPNVAVFTARSIVERRAWVARVSHDEDDGAWQFHDNDPGYKNEHDAMLVSLHSMVERDPTLATLADLPLGWMAAREGPQAAWKRMRNG